VNKTKKTSGFILHSEIQKYRSNKILMFFFCLTSSFLL